MRCTCLYHIAEAQQDFTPVTHNIKKEVYKYDVAFCCFSR